MSLSGNISRPTLLAAWRSPARPISRPRSVHPCVSCRTTRKKSDLSTKNHRSNMLREGELTYGLINKSRLHFGCQKCRRKQGIELRMALLGRFGWRHHTELNRDCDLLVSKLIGRWNIRQPFESV